jgi:predicted nucleotidyltransferase
MFRLMRVHQPLDLILRGRGTLHVLRTLGTRPDRGRSAPELAKSGGLSLSHVQLALSQLEAQGLVDRHVVGRRHEWTLTGENALVPALRDLFAAERKLPSDLIAELRQSLGPLKLPKAVLFGSVARGDESGGSDVDLWIEVKSERHRELAWDELVRLGRVIRSRFGLNLSSIVIKVGEGARVLPSSLLGAIRREGVSVAEVVDG